MSSENDKNVFNFQMEKVCYAFFIQSFKYMPHLDITFVACSFLISFYLLCRLHETSEALLDHRRAENHSIAHKKMHGGILHAKSLRTLKERNVMCYPMSFVLYNTKPLGHQVSKKAVQEFNI